MILNPVRHFRSSCRIFLQLRFRHRAASKESVAVDDNDDMRPYYGRVCFRRNVAGFPEDCHLQSMHRPVVKFSVGVCRDPRLSPAVGFQNYRAAFRFQTRVTSGLLQISSTGLCALLRFAQPVLLIFFSSFCSDSRLLSRRCLHYKLVQQRVFENCKT